jgi:cytochrome c-type biogenesis protein
LNITKIRKNLPKWAIWVGLAMLVAIAIVLAKQLNLLESLASAIARTENQYQQWGESQPLTNPWLLISFAFGGGLLASISPCILAMLPVNLSYIGTLNVKSRRAAFWNATEFVLGVVTMVACALGYIIASLCAGLIKLTRQILVNSEMVMRVGGLALVLMGGYYVVSGVRWFL